VPDPGGQEGGQAAEGDEDEFEARRLGEEADGDRDDEGLDGHERAEREYNLLAAHPCFPLEQVF